jgi:hypothetical protein
MPHQFAVDEAQGALRKGRCDEMGIKVRGSNPPHAQDAAALGLSGVAAPEQRWPSQWPQGTRGARGEANLQQLTAGQMRGHASVCLRCPHDDPSLWHPHACYRTRVTYSQLCNPM